MLRYDLPIRNISSDLKQIELLEWRTYGIYGNDEQALLVCKYKDNKYVKDGKKVMVFTSLANNEEQGGSPNTVTYSDMEAYTLAAVRQSTHTFTLLVEKYTKLDIVYWRIVTDSEGKKATYVYFSGPHYFIHGEENAEIEVLFYGGGEYKVNAVRLKCEYAGYRMLKCDLGEEGENKDAEGLGALLDLLGYSAAMDQSSEFEGWSVDLNVDGLSVRRDNYRFGDMSHVGVYVEGYNIGFQVPLGASESVSGWQEMNVKEKFVDYEISQSINGGVDMEKDMYHPVIYGKDGKQRPVYDIVFNLHFRQHGGDEWQAPADSYWNGVEVNPDGSLSLEYGARDDKSDLLGLLGFEDTDVMYQKSKLKRSFLRLLFYDSTDQAEQTLLYTSTVFFDANKAYAKLMRHRDEGMTVDKETAGADGDEEYRLSGQFVASDTYMSERSSEGFHLYLWREGNQSIPPTDIYMRVEFNHAGFGRVIPFMMPFWDPKKWADDEQKRGIKTFEEIIRDWDATRDEASDGEYGIRQYLKFAYIRMKYRYDSDTGRHVYYLDEGAYGKSAYFDDNKITLNLYEAKMV